MPFALLLASPEPVEGSALPLPSHAFHAIIPTRHPCHICRGAPDAQRRAALHLAGRSRDPLGQRREPEGTEGPRRPRECRPQGAPLPAAEGRRGTRPGRGARHRRHRAPHLDHHRRPHPPHAARAAPGLLVGQRRPPRRQRPPRRLLRHGPGPHGALRVRPLQQPRGPQLQLPAAHALPHRHEDRGHQRERQRPRHVLLRRRLHRRRPPPRRRPLPARPLAPREPHHDAGGLRHPAPRRGPRPLPGLQRRRHRRPGPLLQLMVGRGRGEGLPRRRLRPAHPLRYGHGGLHRHRLGPGTLRLPLPGLPRGRPSAHAVPASTATTCPTRSTSAATAAPPSSRSAVGARTTSRSSIASGRPSTWPAPAASPSISPGTAASPTTASSSARTTGRAAPTSTWTNRPTTCPSWRP